MELSCKHCAQTFVISSDDMAYYAKVSPMIAGNILSIPPPSLCPDCRFQRRGAWRNEHTFYRSTCKNCGRAILSVFNPKGSYTVFCHDCWFGDAWSGTEYAQTIDWDQSFFEQFQRLLVATPHLSMSIWNSDNSDYCNYIGDVKDSYLIFGSVYSQNCYYGSPYYSRDCVDTLVVRNCERCYECIDCRELYDALWCQNCINSHDILFGFDLQGCSDCIACAGLRQKKFCIFNEQLSEDQYRRRRAELNLCDASVLRTLDQRLRDVTMTIPHRYMQSGASEDVSGNFVYGSKNVYNSYYADKARDCRFCAQVVDLKDCYDTNYTEENELCYEYLGAYQNHRVLFSLFCNRVSDALYCYACHRSKNIFGCAGLKNAEYCIFNQQYTKTEYERLVPRLMIAMKQSQEFGEFFPIQISTFAYNETVAGEYFPLSMEETISRGWQWNDTLPYATGRDTLSWESIPAHIDDVPDSITQEALGCTLCARNYRLIPQELSFYRSQKLPIPRQCFDCRHRARLAKRNPRTLWLRSCARCAKDIQTTYAPDRPEKVLCEECYLKEVY